MATVFNILAILVMVAVVIVLIRGLVNMMRGGSGITSNKLMQARVLLQFVALVLILLALYFTRKWRLTARDGATWSSSTRSTPAPATTARPVSAPASGGSKSDLRVEAYGTVDEANACIGLARLHTAAAHPEIDAMLGRIQNDLFDLGADLATPDDGKPLGYEPLRIVAVADGPRRGRHRSRSTSDAAAAADPSSCPAARRPRRRCISPAPSRGAPSA